MKIMHVKRNNIEEFNKEIMHKPGLVKYYLPQCKHCMDFAPEWNKMCMEIQKDYDGNVVIAAIDCSEPQTMEGLQCHKDVGAFPTVLKMDRGEKIKEYGGDRTKDALMEFILREFDVQSKKRDRSKKRHSRKKFSKKEKRGGGHKRIRKTLRKRKGGRHRIKSKILKKKNKKMVGGDVPDIATQLLDAVGLTAHSHAYEIAGDVIDVDGKLHDISVEPIEPSQSWLTHEETKQLFNGMLVGDSVQNAIVAGTSPGQIEKDKLYEFKKYADSIAAEFLASVKDGKYHTMIEKAKRSKVPGTFFRLKRKINNEWRKLNTLRDTATDAYNNAFGGQLSWAWAQAVQATLAGGTNVCTSCKFSHGNNKCPMNSTDINISGMSLIGQGSLILTQQLNILITNFRYIITELKKQIATLEKECDRGGSVENNIKPIPYSALPLPYAPVISRQPIIDNKKEIIEHEQYTDKLDKEAEQIIPEVSEDQAPPQASGEEKVSEPGVDKVSEDQAPPQALGEGKEPEDVYEGEGKEPEDVYEGEGKE